MSSIRYLTTSFQRKGGQKVEIIKIIAFAEIEILIALVIMLIIKLLKDWNK